MVDPSRLWSLKLILLDVELGRRVKQRQQASRFEGWERTSVSDHVGRWTDVKLPSPDNDGDGDDDGGVSGMTADDHYYESTTACRRRWPSVSAGQSCIVPPDSFSSSRAHVNTCSLYLIKILVYLITSLSDKVQNSIN